MNPGERFLAEIRVTANLHHPNLLPLFDSGEAGGLLFYVMPYVAGESLRARLHREKQLPVEDAVRIAVAVGGALDYAHQHGVIHRDLKPENILLQAGQPVVADFGIALAVSNAGGQRVTQTGLSLGTPQYMSPEQATGDRQIDGRSDIYSLGAVLYEMLTGDPPHTASTAQAVIAKVLTERPASVSLARPAVPEHVVMAVERALEKLPADRWRTPGEFASALDAGGAVPSARSGASATSRAARQTPGARFRDPIVLAALGVALAAVAAAVWLGTRHGSAAGLRTTRFALSPEADAPLVYVGEWSTVASPDGQTIVFTAQGPKGRPQLFARPLDQLTSHPIAGTENAAEPVFSPDGAWIAFLSGGKLQKVPIGGGTPIPLANARANNGLDWSPWRGGTLVLGAEGQHQLLARVPASGGTLEEFTHRTDSTGAAATELWPVVLADGRTIVFVLYTGSTAGAVLATTTIDGGVVHSLGVKGMVPLGVIDDRLVWVQADGAVVAAPIDRGRQHVTGAPVPVLEPVTTCRTCNGDAAIRISRSGTVTYYAGTARTSLAWLDMHGRATPLGGGARPFTWPRLSPNGRSVALVADQGADSDIWIFDIGTATLRRLTQGGVNLLPEWSADGKRVFYSSSRRGSRAIWSQPADGTGAPTVAAKGLYDLDEFSVAPDGRSLLIRMPHEPKADLIVADLAAGADTAVRLTPYLVDSYAPGNARISPDGRWAAYESNESGQSEIYVRGYPAPAGVYPVSAGGGQAPMWAPDGKRIFYVTGQSVWAAHVQTSPTFAVLSRERLFDTSKRATNFAGYDVSRDGTRFLVLAPDENDERVVVVTNWVDELRRRTR